MAIKWRLSMQFKDNVLFKDYDSEDDADDALDAVDEDNPWVDGGKKYYLGSLVWSEITQVEVE